jgi:hypothetical protein
MRTSRKRTLGIGLVMTALAVLVGGADGAGAQEGPTLTVSPPRGTEGDPITFTFTAAGCGTPTFTTFTWSSPVSQPETGTEVSAGIWQIDLVDTGADFMLTATCGGGSVTATYDSDVPEFYFLGTDPPVGEVIGTECDQPTATVVVVTADGETSQLDVPVDDEGTFSTGAYPILLDRVEATCGDLVYETIEFGGLPTATTTTTTTTPPGPVAPAAPARPVAGAAAYTG